MAVTYFLLLGCVISLVLACQLAFGDIVPTPSTDCILEDTTYAHGDPVDLPDLCMYGECWMGEIAWLESLPCPVPVCEMPLLAPGHCCPVCEATMPPLCYDEEGREYIEGEVMSDPCRYCECSMGQKICFEAFEHECPSVQNCTSPVTLPGSCCPSCPGGCFHLMKWYDNGAVVNDNPCIPCECSGGNVQCTVLPCATDGSPPFVV